MSILAISNKFNIPIPKASLNASRSPLKAANAQGDVFVRNSRSVSFGDNEHPQEKLQLPIEEVQQFLNEAKEKLLAEHSAPEVYMAGSNFRDKDFFEFQQSIYSKPLTKKERHFIGDLEHEVSHPIKIVLNYISEQCRSGLPEEDITFPELENICDREFAEIVNIYKRYQKLIDLGLVDDNKGLQDVFKLAMESIEAKANSVGHNITVKNEDCLKKTKVSLGNWNVYSIFSNVLGNAVKYTPDKGKIDVEFSMGRDERDRQVLNFSVQDNGIGIKEEDKEAVLRGKRGSNVGNIHGTGYGLRRINSILRHVRSGVIIESEEGKGTKITCPIPISLP